MFQAAIILSLQSIASDGLTFFMNAITSLGDDKVLAMILLGITFGINFRKGVLLLQVFQWGSIANSGLKNFFALPRPTFVNANIQNLQHASVEQTPFTSMGADTFFGSIDAEVVEAFRNQSDPSYGLPSGHVSDTVALWGGIAWLFERWNLRWIALILVVFIGLSRMYLGRHFLGDVLGGAVLGGAILVMAWAIIGRLGFGTAIFEEANLAFRMRIPNLFIYLFMLTFPLVLGIASANIFGKGAGYLIGINSALLLIVSKGIPNDSGSPVKRGLRVCLSYLLYFIPMLILDGVIEVMHLDSNVFVDQFLGAALPSFTSFIGTITLGLKLGLYKDRD
jgi:membrane-associated phospholipid phosphatase